MWISINYKCNPGGNTRNKKKQKETIPQKPQWKPMVVIADCYETASKVSENGVIVVTFQRACCHHLYAIIFVALDHRLQNNKTAPFDQLKPLNPMAPC